MDVIFLIFLIDGPCSTTVSFFTGALLGVARENGKHANLGYYCRNIGNTTREGITGFCISNYFTSLSLLLHCYFLTAHGEQNIIVTEKKNPASISEMCSSGSFHSTRLFKGT